MALASLSLSSPLSSSSSAATVAVDKATSDLLMSPDWTMNMDICDNVNSRLWQAKDVVKAVKKRLQHKSSRVQLLALTLLETLVKNCGDFVHFQIADRNILGEMVKIVKKKADMQVRDKILVLLDAWQEAFGGPGGKYPQYYWAYDELRRSGVEFPKRSSDAVPIFTPAAVIRPTLGHIQAGYGMPSNSSRRLDETMATEIETLSLSSLNSMRDVLDLLNDMLQAVNTGDCEAVKDEVIIDLVNHCRANQKKLMQMLTMTGDEDLLGRGLELNDSLQILLAKHDAIASGSPLPSQFPNLSPQRSEACCSSAKSIEPRDPGPKPNTGPSTPSSSVTRVQIDEEEEEDDEFAQLARRHTRTNSIPSNAIAAGTDGVEMPEDSSIAKTSPVPGESASGSCTALALPDPPAAVKTSKEQDMIDLLSLTLTTTSISPQTPPCSGQNVGETLSPSSTKENLHAPSPTSSQGNLHSSSQEQGYYSSYVVPWAQPQAQAQVQPQPWARPQVQLQPWVQPQTLTQPRTHYPQQPHNYPLPPWAESPGYLNSQQNYSTYSNNQNHLPATNMPFTTPASSSAPYTFMQTERPLQHSYSFPSRPMPGSSNMTTYDSRYPTPAPAQKPFVPSYRLFEDLNVLNSADRNLKPTSSSASMSGSPGQWMVGGKK